MMSQEQTTQERRAQRATSGYGPPAAGPINSQANFESFELIKHYAFSRDQTKSSGFEKDRLLAVGEKPDAHFYIQPGPRPAEGQAAGGASQFFNGEMTPRMRAAAQQQAQQGQPGQGPQGSPMLAQVTEGTALNAFNNPNEMGGPGGGSNYALSDHQMQLMLLEQQNKKRLMMARQEQDTIGNMPRRSYGPDGPNGPGIPTGPKGPPFQRVSPQGGRHDASRNQWQKRNAPHMNNDKMDSPLPEGAQPTFSDQMNQQMMEPRGMDTQREDTYPGSDWSRIIRRLTELEDENKRLNALEQPGNPPPRLQVFHKIQGNSTTYLTAPSWITGPEENCFLIGHSPIVSENRYLDGRPDIALVVYAHYIEVPWDDVEMFVENGAPPDPKPVRHSIKLLSKEIITATNSLFSGMSRPGSDSSDWKTSGLMKSPFPFWYHYRSRSCLDDLCDAEREHLQLLTGWIDSNYSDVFEEAKSLASRGLVSRRVLPLLFLPGDVLVQKIGPEAKDIRGFVASSWAWESDSVDSESDEEAPQKKTQPRHTWSLQCWSYEYDGKFLRRYEKVNFDVQSVGGNQEIEITSLSAFPVEFADAEVKDRLKLRGQRFWKCRYRGILSSTHGPGERFMVDFSTYRRLHPPKNARTLAAEGPEYMTAEVMACDNPPEMPDIMVFPSTFTAYNLRTKKWLDIHVDLCEDVQWNAAAFDHLVLEDKTKKLLKALVTNKLRSEQGTDIIEGKGNGLIVLLHGGPGTGKTFTAESVAEMAQKPLFRVTCGDIGTHPEAVEKYLDSVLYLGKLWDCIVLLDEADVFLEERVISDLERNALVAVFLRILEYYEGILILTSNRVGTFDEAFKSRIQLALHYKPLQQHQRAKIWSNFLKHLKRLEKDKIALAKPGDGHEEAEYRNTRGIDFVELDAAVPELAARQLNGRQIRNIITLARQLAHEEGVGMRYSHLQEVIEITSSFDKDLKMLRD